MAKLIDEYIKTCLPCEPANPRTRPEPLKPQMLPDRPWQKLHADFKGPIGKKYYLHIVIDQYSKYPEVDIVKSTEFSKVEPCLNRIMATHGIPEELTTDNGSPYFGHEMERYSKKMGFNHHLVTPLDPQSNGFAENFVKQMCKLVHTSIVKNKDAKKELNTYLLHYRSAPHTTTGKSPAEMLFGRKIQSKLPQMYQKNDTLEISKICARHNEKKLLQKQYADARRQPIKKDITPGDLILIKQNKTTTKPPFDPKPYKVTKVKGNQVTANRFDQTKTRSKSHVKRVNERPAHLRPSWQKHPQIEMTNNDSDSDIDLQRILKRFNTEPGLDDQPLIDVVPSVEEVNEAPPSSQEYSLYDINSHEAQRMQLLLDNMNEEKPRYSLRGACKLEWNPKMNSGTTVIEKTNE